MDGQPGDWPPALAGLFGARSLIRGLGCILGRGSGARACAVWADLAGRPTVAAIAGVARAMAAAAEPEALWRAERVGVAGGLQGSARGDRAWARRARWGFARAWTGA